MDDHPHARLANLLAITTELQETNAALQEKVFAFIEQLGEATQYHIPGDLGFSIKKEGKFTRLSFWTGEGCYTIITDPEQPQIWVVMGFCDFLITHPEGEKFLEWLKRLVWNQKSLLRFISEPAK